MKNIYKIAILILTITFSSCMKDVLDKKPLDIISGADVWEDKDLIDAYLVQTFANTYVLTNECANNDNWGYGDVWFGQFVVNDVSDECKPNWWVGDAMLKKYGNLRIEGGLLEWWEGSYQVIRLLNQFIQKVPESPVDENFKKIRVAEARFIRAFNYFAMVKRYGGVPIITKVQSLDDPENELYPKRNKEKEVYDFILSEIDAIVNDLPASTADFGRPTKYAALALKSRAALYAASIADFGNVMLEGTLGIAKSEADKYYKISYDASTEIMNGPNSLYDNDADKVENYKNIFLVKNNVEIIFARKHDYSDKEAGGMGWSYDFFQAPSPDAWGGGTQDGVYLEMVEEFEHIDGTPGNIDKAAIQQGLWSTDDLWGQKDPRFKASVYTQNDGWKGNPIDFYNGIRRSDGTITTEGSYNGILAVGNQYAAKRGTGFGVMKYLEESKDNMGPRATSGTDYIVFRYGEILLNYAEAAFELGKTGDALGAINLLRERAGIIALTSIDREKVHHERKVELAFEGHRYWDVRRWRTATTDLTRSFSGLRYILDYDTRKFKLEVVYKIDGAVDPTFFERNYYLPINPVRTGTNPNMFENPGY